LLFVAVAGLMAAATSLSDKKRGILVAIAMGAFVLQIAIVTVLYFYQQQLIHLVYGNRPDDEGVQNISRDALVMGAAAPFLLLTMLERGGGAGWLSSAVVAAGIIALLIGHDMQAGLLAMVLAGACVGVVAALPRHGFRVIGCAVAAFLMSAPVLFGFVARGAETSTAVTSMDYRRIIWDRVLDIVWQSPITGSGLGVLRAHSETIPDGAFAGQLFIPNHAHNMTLQLWAETGGIGAALLSVAIILAAFRLPAPSSLGAQGRRAAALVGVMLAVCTVSFDLWNEFWWAIGGLLAVLAILTSKNAAPKNKKQVRTITFGEPVSTDTRQQVP
jgi:O-antigen ligase